MADIMERALELLRLGTGLSEAAFRDGQEAAIRHVVENRGRLLVVQKTGWGKSFVYFIATKLLRERGHGPALLISPLLALMRNQIAAAERMGVRAETINSDNVKDWAEIEKRIDHDHVDILIISPERLANQRFREQALSRISSRLSLLVVDEAHCISDWGHDFRPHYRLLERIVRTLPPNLRLLATTATANQRVMDDLSAILGQHLRIIRGDLNRPSLTLQSVRLPGQAERLAWLAQLLAQLPGSGIIYALTVHDANLVANWLAARGLDVAAYTGETGDAREGLEQALIENRIKALVATSALGMGFDKPDLSFVVHYQAPGSVVAYYQQVGRAGRALDAAYGILLSGQEDTEITDWFIESAFPSRQEVDMVLATLERAPGGLTLSELQSHLNLSRGRIDKTLELLSLESPAPLVRQSDRWQLAPVRLGKGFWQRVDRLTALRRAEQAQMQAYVDLPFGEHMGFLIRALDGDPCTVMPPLLPPLSVQVDPALAREAIVFLRRSSLPIEPRRQWPGGGMAVYGLQGRIREEYRAQPGRALCMWRDAGWGRLVYDGKYHYNHFADELVSACVEMVRSWQPQPAPEWVTCISSLRHPQLVPVFSRRLAKELDLPFHAVLERVAERPEQKTMANSVQQARNLDGALDVRGPVPAGPVLLVDDMVDSGWTFTVAAWLLRQSGSGPVWPCALATTGQG